MRPAALQASALLGAAGAWIVLGLPWPPLPRLLFLIAWTGSMLAGMGRQLRGFSAARQYVIRPGGDVDIVGPGGRIVPAMLVDGSTVFSRIAWLRFRTTGGQGWGELIRDRGGAGKHLKNKEWRRLLVICRHHRAC